MGTRTLSLKIKWPESEADHHFHIMPTSRMRGSISPFPSTLLERRAQLKKQIYLMLPYENTRTMKAKFLK